MPKDDISILNHRIEIANRERYKAEETVVQQATVISELVELLNQHEIDHSHITRTKAS